MQYLRSNAVPNKPVGDQWYNKLQLIVPMPNSFEVGQQVVIKSISGNYDGIRTVGYRYDNPNSSLGPISALYFADTEFFTTDTGSIEPYTSAVNPSNRNDVTANPGTILNTGTSATYVEQKPVIKTAETKPAETEKVNLNAIADLTTQNTEVPTEWYKKPVVQIVGAILAVIIILKIINKQ